MTLVATLTITQDNEESPTSIICSYTPTINKLGIKEVEDLPDCYYLMGWTYSKLNEYLAELNSKGAIDTVDSAANPQSIN